MSAQLLFIPGTLPGLNDLLHARTSVSRRTSRKAKGKRWEAFNAIKQGLTRDISLLVREQGLLPVKRARITFLWIERDHRRDPDNVSGGGRKVILDALVCARILPDDGWDEIIELTDRWIVDPRRVGVEVTIDDEPAHV